MFKINIDKNIYISLNKVFLYLILYGITLSLGYFLKSGIGIVAFFIFIFLLFSKDKDSLILFIIFWLYVYNFFIGQGWVSNELISKYLIKGELYVIIAFFVLVRKSWFRSNFNKKLFNWAIIFLLIILLSDVLHFNFNLNFINQIYFIFVFFLILYLPKKKSFENNLFNLIIAIGLLEVIVSFLQVSQMIAPPIKIIESYTYSYLSEVSLLDAASGTFGAEVSNVTSWFETILFLTFFSFGVYKKNLIIVYFSFIFMLQYATIDSKTAIGVSALTFIFLLYQLKIFNVFKIKNLIYVIFIISFIFVSKSLMTSYYENMSRKGIHGPVAMVSNSVDIVFTNWQDWGKIAGFKNITEDYMKKNPLFLLIGYGRENFNYFNNSGRIEDMDTPIMQLNNITRSRSSFISAYGTLGIPGLFMLIWLFVILFKSLRKQNFNTVLGNSFKQSGNAILFGSMIFMFLYGGHTYNDLAFLLFFILYALVLRIENNYSKSQFLT